MFQIQVVELSVRQWVVLLGEDQGFTLMNEVSECPHKGTLESYLSFPFPCEDCKPEDSHQNLTML